MARLGSSSGALPLPSRASQVRCRPVSVPSRAVTAPSKAGQDWRGASELTRYQHAGMKSQGRPIEAGGDRAAPQIGFGKRAGNGLGEGEQALGGKRSALEPGRRDGSRMGLRTRSGSRRNTRASAMASRQSLKPLLSRMRSSRSPYSAVAEFGPAPGSFADKFDEQAPAPRAGGIADNPVAARAPSVRKIGAAHGFGLLAEAAGEFGCGAHGRPTRFPQRQPRQPAGSAGTAATAFPRRSRRRAARKSRKRQAMISLKKPKDLQLLDLGIAEACQLDALRAHDG